MFSSPLETGSVEACNGIVSPNRYNKDGKWKLVRGWETPKGRERVYGVEGGGVQLIRTREAP